MERKCYLQSFLMKLVQIRHLPKQQHVYVVFKSSILFGECYTVISLLKNTRQVFDMNGFRAAIALKMAN